MLPITGRRHTGGVSPLVSGASAGNDGSLLGGSRLNKAFKVVLCVGLVLWFCLNLSFLWSTNRTRRELEALIQQRLQLHSGKLVEGEQVESVVLRSSQAAAFLAKATQTAFAPLSSSRAIIAATPLDSEFLHGRFGFFPNGTTYWSPKPKPTSQRMHEALRLGGGFNLALSDSLPLDRAVPDSRNDLCKSIKYPDAGTPAASVIIVFYNEPFSTLMRSVHSVLNRTPQNLLHEIILVDDGSDLPWIKTEIEDYIKLLPKTRLVRSPVRKGIVSARMLGIRNAEASIFVILDSHIEVNHGWVEPLVSRIGEDKSRIVMPSIDGMDPETFAASAGGIGCTLGFLWKLIEHGYDADAMLETLPSRLHTGPADYVTSPAMAGGLFAANTDYFLNELGGYDELFEFWGTENLELSFRTWMCGGKLECAPCSRVYHIFRKGGVGYSSPSDSVTKNKMRLMTVWMDEFADLAWRVIGKPRVDFGPVEHLKRFKEEKQCKNFTWFLDNVNPESFVRRVPEDVPFLGMLRNTRTDQCLTYTQSAPGGKVFMSTCRPGMYSQEFMYFRRVKHVMPVMNDEACWTAQGKIDTVDWCNINDAVIEIDRDSGRLYVPRLQKCIGAVEKNHLPEFVDCQTGSHGVEWEFEKYEPPEVFTPPPV